MNEAKEQGGCGCACAGHPDDTGRRSMLTGALAILFVLFAYRPATTWPGLVIVLAGVPVYLLARGSGRA